MEFEKAKAIIGGGYGNSWFGGDYKMNIYRGCNHGCIYCDSRSDCYQIANFDTVRAKENAVKMINNELRSKRKKGVVATGATSDPYNPFEKKYQLTLGALKALDQHHFGIALSTKSTLITRDIKLYQDISRHSPVVIKFTITTPHDEISRIIEPHVATSSQRFAAITELSSQGVFTGILLMPLMPFISDDPRDVASLVELAARAGAKFIYPAYGLTMRDGQREYLYKKLDEHYPGMKVRYQRQFGDSYYCNSIYYKEIDKIFTATCKKYGILYTMPSIVKAYKSPYDLEQISLF